MTATSPSRPTRLAAVDHLTDRAALQPLFGPIREIVREPLRTTGYSGSTHERLWVVDPSGRRTPLILKRTRPAEDWTCRISGATRSREVQLLDCEELEDVWSVFSCPYLAHAEDEDAAGLLMHDLTSGLFPDVREPLSGEDEGLLLRSLARLHARFWERTPGARMWLSSLDSAARLLDSERALGGGDMPPEPMRSALQEGWRHALRVAPGWVAERLRTPVGERAAEWDRLPRTMVHGDVKIANFAVVPGARVAAFDWAMIGWAPCSADLGWYLAVNASRLARSKEETIRTYRSMLEIELEGALTDDAWRSLEDAAIEIGARMLLWSKANALAQGSAGAREEWDWWMTRLD